MDVTVNGDPVPETAGDPVRWEDVPNRHAYCDGEIRRLRAEVNRVTAERDGLRATLRVIQAGSAAAVLAEPDAPGDLRITGAGTEHLAAELVNSVQERHPGRETGLVHDEDVAAELAEDAR